jgi:lysozyme
VTACDLIKRLEGYEPKAYPDPATGGKPWTIGYGHTGQGIGPGMVWTGEQCEAQLAHDLTAFETVIDDLVKVPITSSERAALVSFAFNEGSHQLSNGECKIIPLLNAGDHLSAAGQFMHFTKAAGRPGFLRNRRMAEIEVFLSELGVL